MRHKMKKTFLLVITITGLVFCQSFKVDKVTGTVKALDSNDNWIEVKEGTTIPPNSVLVADKKSSVKISGEGINFSLKESSAIPVSSIKKMTVDELLLALAMEDMINAPRKKENDNGKSTAVYGSKEGGNESDIAGSDDFGIKRINGAMQLAENDFKESAVVTARETFRKYPSTKEMANYRIYFANLLYDFGLNEEAYDEFTSIKELKLSDKEKSEVAEKLSQLNKKLVNK
jgi:hypothetical protein